MLGGPYPPRVVPVHVKSGGGGGSAPQSSKNSIEKGVDEFPSVQRVGTQWNGVATPPSAPTPGLLQLSSATPCGIPWNRLYSSTSINSNTVASSPEERVERTFDDRTAAPQHQQEKHSNAITSLKPAAVAATSSLLYRPSYFTASYTAAPPPGAPATVQAYSTAAGHHYHNDETDPTSSAAAVKAPASIITSSTALSHRYQQLAAEHQYGSALPAAPSNEYGILARSGKTGGSAATPATEVTGGAATTLAVGSQRRSEGPVWEERSAETPRRNAFRDHPSVLQPPRQQGSARSSSHSKQRYSPFSDGSDHDDDREVSNANATANDRSAETVQTTRSQHSRPSLQGSHTETAAQECSFAATAGGTAASHVAVAAAEKEREEVRCRRPGSRGSARDSARSSSSRLQSRDSRARQTPSPQQCSRLLRTAPRRTRSAEPRAASGGGSPLSCHRTAQWAVKLIEELVAQVAVQQASSTTGLTIVSPSSMKAGRHRSSSAHHASRDATTTTTVADLTTSFLSSRYGALQWRPMLQEFAVCLHRYHHLSPACAVFREYFIHVDADTLNDFQLLCRLFAAADIPHCSSVEVRRVALGGRTNSHHQHHRHATHTEHTIVARRYVELREVVDRLQRMLQKVVLMDTAPCLVVGDYVGGEGGGGRAAVPRTSGRRYQQESFTSRSVVPGAGAGGQPQYRYARGPPARTVTVPRRRRLTADEVRAVKKVVMTWLEDSIEAERVAMELSSAEDDNSDGHSSRVDDGDDGDSPTTLRHVAFDRPGLVDAYALLQATLEAVKLLCSSSQPLHPSPDRADASGTESDFSCQVDNAAFAQGERKRSEVRRQRRLSGSPPRQQPLWKATASHPHSPLVRHILASPPGGHAYPVEEVEKQQTFPLSSPRRRPQPRRPSSSSCLSPLREVHHARRPAGEWMCASYDDEMGGEEEVEAEAYADSWEGAHHRDRHGSRRGSGEPSFRRPRRSAAATAAAVAERRSVDGRLWSPPREGVIMATTVMPRSGDEKGRDSAHRAGEARGSPSRRQSSARERRRGDVRPQRSHDSYGDSDAADYTEGEYEHDHDYSPRRHASSLSRSRCSPLGKPPRSPTSSPSRYRHLEQESPHGSQHQHNPASSSQVPHVPHAYVADLHAERRWQEAQRQVAAAERRAECWRQHPRIQARLQQQHRQSVLGTSGRDSSTKVVRDVAEVASPRAVDATIDDIDRELHRRERNYGCSQMATPSPPPPPPPQRQQQRHFPARINAEVMYLRDPQEEAATVLANPHIRLVPPPSFAQPVFPEAYPSRIYQKQEYAQRPPITVAPPVGTPGSQSRIRVEQVTPLTSVATHVAADLQNSAEQPQSVVPAVATASATPPLLPSAGLRFTQDAKVSKDRVLLTDEEQAMLEQLEVALHRLDMQHRRDHAAAASAATTSTDGG
jgi:hypothetical protein